MLIVSVHNNIKEYRMKKNITQKELASLVGCTETYINKLENNHVDKPSVDLIGKISYVLSVSAAILFVIKVHQRYTINNDMLKRARYKKNSSE